MLSGFPLDFARDMEIDRFFRTMTTQNATRPLLHPKNKKSECPKQIHQFHLAKATASACGRGFWLMQRRL